MGGVVARRVGGGALVGEAKATTPPSCGAGVPDGRTPLQEATRRIAIAALVQATKPARLRDPCVDRSGACTLSPGGTTHLAALRPKAQRGPENVQPRPRTRGCRPVPGRTSGSGCQPRGSDSHGWLIDRKQMTWAPARNAAAGILRFRTRDRRRRLASSFARRVASVADHLREPIAAGQGNFWPRSGVGPRQSLHRQLVERCPLDPGWSGLGLSAEAASREPALEAPPAMLEVVAEIDFVQT